MYNRAILSLVSHDVSESEGLVIDLSHIKEDVLLTAHHNFDCLTKLQYDRNILTLVFSDVSAWEGSVCQYIINKACN